MSDAEFLAVLTGRDDDLRLAIDAFRAAGQPFCLIGASDDLRGPARQ